MYFIHILISPNICTFSDMEPLLHPYPYISIHISALLNMNFLTWRTPKFNIPKILPDALSPTQIEPKEPKWQNILILTMRQVHTYFSSTLPFGALIWVALIWVAFFKRAKIAQPSSNHLKIKPHHVPRMCNLLNFILLSCSLLMYINFIKFVKYAKWQQIKQRPNAIYSIENENCTWKIFPTSKMSVY